MPAAVSTDYFPTPEISAAAADPFKASGVEAVSPLPVPQTTTEAPLRPKASLGEGDNMLVHQAVQYFPQASVGLAVVFGLALLLAAAWTLYGASLRRPRLKH